MPTKAKRNGMNGEKEALSKRANDKKAPKKERQEKSLAIFTKSNVALFIELNSITLLLSFLALVFLYVKIELSILSSLALIYYTHILALSFIDVNGKMS